MEQIVFTRDVAALTAQLAAILVIAFVVEFRALGRQRATNGKGFGVFLLIPFFCFGVVVLFSLITLNGDGNLEGPSAALSWTSTVGGLGVLLVYVGVVVRAMVSVSAEDLPPQVERDRLLESRLRAPAWRWFFFPASRDPGEDSQMGK